MDFVDSVKEFSIRIDKLKDNINTEEATKTSMILPFFQILGYDIFNPTEFVPEYIADTGTKKGEKVDYAILSNGEPIIIIEAKQASDTLNTRHTNQLFRYFTVTKARFAILTNGIKYRFYTDLEEPNKMDMTPFLEIDLLKLKPDSIDELKKFRKDIFNEKGILGSASELKYKFLLKNAIEEQFTSPSEQFIRALIKNFYVGAKTQKVIDKFKQLTLIALNEYINDLINEKLQEITPTKIEPDRTAEKMQPIFNKTEIETLKYIEKILPKDQFIYKKKKRYAYIHLLESQNKWICRVFEQKEKNSLVLHKFENTEYETEYYYDDISQLDQIKNLIIDTYKKCKQSKSNVE